MKFRELQDGGVIYMLPFAKRWIYLHVDICTTE